MIAMASISVTSTPSWSALRRKERRRHRRYQVAGSTLRVSYLDMNGTLKMVAAAQVLNVSESGMALELPEKPLPTSMIRFQSERFKLTGSAAVRHAQKITNSYMVGVEFATGLRWIPPDCEVEEPIPLCDVP
jgi:hypothetical protein